MSPRARTAPIAALLVTLGLLATVQLAVKPPMLLAERFLPGAGWAEILALSLWAAFLAGRLLDARRAAAWRRRLWTLFSAVFFAQLALGLLGVERCLMTGSLHLPVPAMIVGGPLWRGHGLFMPILFAATLLLVGPAWCSFLCYLGAWDLTAARANRRPAALPRWRGPFRVLMLGLVAGVALVLRALDAPSAVATLLGALFGVVGVLSMLALSTRTGAMVHCVVWCPVGLLADLGGRLSPFRLRIVSGCTDCSACLTACRYDALSEEDVRRRRPGLTCTLCGDCLPTCRGGFIEYRFLGLSSEAARSLFAVMVASLHAVFAGVARL